LIQSGAGKFAPIVVPSGASPLGTWPRDVLIGAPYNQNQQGDVVFFAVGDRASQGGTFFWEAKSQKVTAIAREGMPATQNLTFAAIAGGFGPSINNKEEIAFPAAVQSGTGTPATALFFRSADGTILPVLLPDQLLPGGERAHSDLPYPYYFPSLDETGTVAFLAWPQGQKQNNGYRWQQGSIVPVVRIGDAVPGGGKITSVTRILVNNRNRNVLVAAGVDGNDGQQGLYLVADGNLMSIAVPGQEMPGGGRLHSLAGVLPSPWGQSVTAAISNANESGQHAFVGVLEDGGTAAYQMEPNGKLSLILQSGTPTELGRVTILEDQGVALNTGGQVALDVQLDGGPATLVLLTPATR
jgi:hypothetical protein